ncbi:hypothetical protein [Halosimplex halophilum]|uniref:hypothetical protein n=1 Tax=Halosimplex halophilum TaxID=2559572 RepID=UPI0014354458|nr:hypothetical protein [Halosimplex halophilum]
MGSSINSSYPSDPPDDRESGEGHEERPELGDLLSGRLSDVDIDSVAAVREERERG